MTWGPHGLEEGGDPEGRQAGTAESRQLLVSKAEVKAGGGSRGGDRGGPRRQLGQLPGAAPCPEVAAPPGLGASGSRKSALTGAGLSVASAKGLAGPRAQALGGPPGGGAGRGPGQRGPEAGEGEPGTRLLPSCRPEAARTACRGGPFPTDLSPELSGVPQPPKNGFGNGGPCPVYTQRKPGAPGAASTQLQGLQAGHMDPTLPAHGLHQGQRAACPGPPLRTDPRPCSPDPRLSPSGALEWCLAPSSGEVQGPGGLRALGTGGTGCCGEARRPSPGGGPAWQALGRGFGGGDQCPVRTGCPDGSQRARRSCSSSCWAES